MKAYLNFLNHILENGVEKQDRTQTGVLSSFGYQMRFNIENSFPLLTTKKIHLKSVIHELLWFLKGDTNIKYLQENGVKIWDEWADENGDLGPVYGKQWRSWQSPSGETIDQIKNLISSIKKDPDSRRHIVVAYNPSDIDQMKLPPCHCFFQFYCANAKLSCQLYQRSADAFLGVPFNIASYSLLTYMIAQVCNLKAYEFIHSFGDAHIYKNHIEQVKTQLQRKTYDPPQMILNPEIKDIFDFKFEDFELKNYKSHPHIPGKVAV